MKMNKVIYLDMGRAQLKIVSKIFIGICIILYLGIILGYTLESTEIFKNSIIYFVFALIPTIIFSQLETGLVFLKDEKIFQNYKFKFKAIKPGLALYYASTHTRSSYIHLGVMMSREDYETITYMFSGDQGYKASSSSWKTPPSEDKEQYKYLYRIKFFQFGDKESARIYGEKMAKKLGLELYPGIIQEDCAFGIDYILGARRTRLDD